MERDPATVTPPLAPRDTVDTATDGRLIVVRERNRPAAHVVIDRPDKHNAFDRAMWQSMARIFADLSADNALRCVTICGAGGQAFSTGADIGEFSTVRRTANEAEAYARDVHEAWRRFAECPVPTIAVIDGLCVGGGLETACHADLRIASDDSRFGIPIKRLGLVLAYEEMAPVLALIGAARLSELLYLGRLIDAEAAVGWGLVNRVVAKADLNAEIEAMVEDVVTGAPLVARWHKRFMKRLLSGDDIDAAERATGYACYDTDDFRAGFSAFLTKTRPEFTGR